MTRSTITAIGTAFAMMVFAAPSMAQAVCGKHADIVERLRNGYEEQQSSAGTAANGCLGNVLASIKANCPISFTGPVA